MAVMSTRIRSFLRQDQRFEPLPSLEQHEFLLELLGVVPQLNQLLLHKEVLRWVVVFALAVDGVLQLCDEITLPMRLEQGVRRHDVTARRPTPAANAAADLHFSEMLCGAIRNHKFAVGAACSRSCLESGGTHLMGLGPGSSLAGGGAHLRTPRTPPPRM